MEPHSCRELWLVPPNFKESLTGCGRNFDLLRNSGGNFSVPSFQPTKGPDGGMDMDFTMSASLSSLQTNAGGFFSGGRKNPERERHRKWRIDGGHAAC